MKPIRRILVPTDFSDNAGHAFRYALQLAGSLKAEVSVINVVYPDYDMGMDFPVVAAQVTEEKLAVGKEIMDGFVRQGLHVVFGEKKERPPVGSEVLPGMPVETIVRTCKEKNTDLIIMGTRGEHSPWEKWVGTVAAGVVQQASCHVLVVPEKAPSTPPRTIACATDLSTADPYQVWKAAQLLKIFEPRLYCVHVATGQNGGARIEEAELREFFQDDDTYGEVRFFNIKGESTAESLNEFAESHQVDLLVAFRPNRGFLERMLHHSITRELAIHCSLPLLVVKPG